jgi:tetratricopeptide (TPR) repeat protein
MARANKSKKLRSKRVSGRLLDPLEVAWLETKIAEKFSTKGDFYAAYKTATGRSQDPERQLQRILNSDDPITPPARIIFAKTLGMTIDEFDAGLRECLGGPSRHPDDEKKHAAERRWQYIQNHPIRGVEIIFILKGAVGFDWFRELLEETRLTFSRDEPSFKLGQLLALAHEPNTKEPSPKTEKPICSFWEIYEPEKGYWFKKITPSLRTFATVAGFDARAPWSVLGVGRIEKLQDIGMLTEVGISIPSRAYQVGVEEFEVRFLGDTFSFSVKLSDHALEAMHSLGREFASFQKPCATDDEPIPVGTSFGGVELLEMFHQQLIPRPKSENPKSRGGIAGMAGPGGKAISFFPAMPPGYMKTPESHEYSFKITVPGKVDTESRIKELEAKLKTNPADAKSYAELAAVYSHLGRLQDAMRWLEIGIEKVPADPDVHGMKAEMLSKMGRFDEALALYRKAEKLCPKDDSRIRSAVQNGIGVCLHELGNDDEALHHFQAAARLEPSKANYQFNLSMAFAAVDRYADALAPARRAVELMPDDHRSARHLGVLLMIVDRTADAIPHFEKATQLSPKSAEVHEFLGESLRKMNQHEKAVISLQRAIEIEETARRYDLLAGSLADLDRWPEAEAAFRRVAELEPNNSQALVNIGATLANQQKLQEALRFFEQAVSVNPSNTDAQAKVNALREFMARR